MATGFTGAFAQETTPTEPVDSAEREGAFTLPTRSSQPLTLREAIHLALANNRSLEKAGLDRESQRFDLRVAEDEFVPNLDLTSNVRYNPITTNGNEVTTSAGSVSAAVSQRAPTGARFGLIWDNFATDLSTQSPKIYDSNLYLELNQPLLRGGGIKTNLTNLRVARLSEQTNVLEYRRIVMNTITSVVFTYRNLLQAQLQVDVSRAALERAQEQLRINNALVSSGIIAPVEIVQTEADIANQRFNLLTAESILDSARFSLVKILDVDRSTVYRAVDTLALPEFALDVVTARRLAYENRPDYQQVLQGKQASELSEYAARNNRLWALNLSSRYRLAGTDNSFPNALDRSFSRLNEDWAVGLTLQVPFGDLTREQNHLRARIRDQKAGLDVTEITENIEIEVRESRRTVLLAQQRAKVAETARGLAERKLEIEKGKLQVGRTTNFAIVTFQNDLITSRLNEIAAQIAYLNSLTSFEQTLGTTLTVWGVRIEDLSRLPARAEIANSAAPTP
ncbi:TolC family protein [Oleiharenicola lentus]|uniref:TolC family protein n=1 Tax=Oleiharenicola lentus TaxID=2508720 RepID=UPI003F6819CC